jgi:hypothetical protein
VAAPFALSPVTNAGPADAGSTDAGSTDAGAAAAAAAVCVPTTGHRSCSRQPGSIGSGRVSEIAVVRKARHLCSQARGSSTKVPTGILAYHGDDDEEA